MKKMIKILLCIVLALSLLSCQNSNSSNESETQTNTTQKENKKEERTKNVQLVHPLVCEEIQKIQNYNTKDYETKKDMKNEVTIRIPQIDFKTSDAEEFNRQMQEFAKREYERYQWYITEKIGWEYDTDYRFFKNEDIVSIILFQKYAKLENKEMPFSEYDFLNIKTVNFNARTGEIMKDEEILKAFKIENYEKKILSAIYNFGKGFRKRILESTPPEEREQAHAILSCSIATSNTIFWRALYNLENRPNNYYDMSEHNDPNKRYWLLDDSEHLNKLPQLFYNEEENALFASVKIGTPAGAGFYYENVNIQALEGKEAQLNPVYAYYAKTLGFDPNAEDAPTVLSTSLGYIGDELIFNRLQSIKDNANLDFKELLDVKINDYDSGMTLSGEELFVLIPKYEDISLSFSHIQRDEQNKESITSVITLSGNVFLKSNPSDLYSNCEVQINYKDRLIKYQPHISLVDSSNEVVEGVMDISDIIENQLPDNVDDAKNYLEKFLPKG